MAIAITVIAVLAAKYISLEGTTVAGTSSGVVAAGSTMKLVVDDDG